MRNSEVQAYIERLYDAIYSGLPDGGVIDELTDAIGDFEEEVVKQMQAEEEQNSGFDSTQFFSNLAEADDEELINFCERMDEVHPSLGKFAKYLMEEDDPTFFIAYGEEKHSIIGRSSDMWAFSVASLIRNKIMKGGGLNDK